MRKILGVGRSPGGTARLSILENTEEKTPPQWEKTGCFVSFLRKHPVKESVDVKEGVCVCVYVWGKVAYRRPFRVQTGSAFYLNKTSPYVARIQPLCTPGA